MAKVGKTARLGKSALDRAATTYATGEKTFKPRRVKKAPEYEFPVTVTKIRRMTLRDCHQTVVSLAMQLAEGDRRRLEVIDRFTILVHNRPYHLGRK